MSFGYPFCAEGEKEAKFLLSEAKSRLKLFIIKFSNFFAFHSYSYVERPEFLPSIIETG